MPPDWAAPRSWPDAWLRLAFCDRFAPRDQLRVLAALEDGAPLERRDRRRLAAGPDDGEAQRLLDEMESRREHLLVARAAGYPVALHDLSDPPGFLFHTGPALAELGREVRGIGIVGSRAASPQGVQMARRLGRDLALSGAVVISGLARGIDGAAHRGCLDGGGVTLAVLGCGLDEVYPPEHAHLRAAIARTGSVLTEFPPGVPPRKLNFPRRNRILAALCAVLVVVEGRERSGARSTVDHALDLGREVMAVPRDPTHPGSDLPNRLLRDGARPVLTFRDVLAALTEEGSLRGASAPGIGVASASARSVARAPARSGEGGEDPRGRALRAGDAASASGDEPARPRRGAPAGGETKAESALASGRAASMERLPQDLRALLASGPLTLEEAIEGTGEDASAVRSLLSEMEVLGEVTRTREGAYVHADVR